MGFQNKEQQKQARPVVLRYLQVLGVDFIELHLLVASNVTIQTMAVLRLIFNGDIEQINVETAFLYGLLLKKIYLQRPDGYKFTGDVI